MRLLLRWMDTAFAKYTGCWGELVTDKQKKKTPVAGPEMQ